MPLWTYTRGPGKKWVKESVATKKGWINPLSPLKEVLVCISNLAVRKGASKIAEVQFDQAAYVQSDPVNVVVRFDELVNVTAGATLVLSWTGISGDVTATAAAQLNVNDVVFAAVVPAEAGTLSLAAQSVVGTIVDNDGSATPSNKAISAGVAAAVGTRVVA